MITLIGDATNGLSPIGGAGADLAIINAVDLANMIANHKGNYSTFRRDDGAEVQGEDRIFV
jgi:2-polyprenyl-6-methoxyphenol hydroxylase-like FAD-dependent oxidoreductase